LPTQQKAEYSPISQKRILTGMCSRY
jgi:hypothetical protein